MLCKRKFCSAFFKVSGLNLISKIFYRRVESEYHRYIILARKSEVDPITSRGYGFCGFFCKFWLCGLFTCAHDQSTEWSKELSAQLHGVHGFLAPLLLSFPNKKEAISTSMSCQTSSRSGELPFLGHVKMNFPVDRGTLWRLEQVEF